MPAFKVVIGTKDGKCVQQEVKDPDAAQFLGKKLGEIVKGELLGHAGWEFQITGGSDIAGFPMRPGIDGAGRRRILALGGVGVRAKHKSKAARTRKTVCGTVISQSIVQINVKPVKEGKEALVKAEAKPEEKKE